MDHRKYFCYYGADLPDYEHGDTVEISKDQFEKLTKCEVKRQIKETSEGWLVEFYL